jgi:hypothetical protein
MTETQDQNQAQLVVPSDKELNFRRLEAKYQQELAVERARREEAERQAQALAQSHRTEPEDDDDDSEPYVDHKRLNKKLDKFGKSTNSNIQKAMQEAKELAKEELKQELFLENHEDFHQVLELAETFAQKHPKLAENILRMPQGFERQKLVYQTIKELGLDKPKTPEPTIQQKIDANRKAPYYQPSGVGASPYHSASDFSQSGQKQAYDKMKELQSRLRL